jgi:hypothetical protein
MKRKWREIQNQIQREPQAAQVRSLRARHEADDGRRETASGFDTACVALQSLPIRRMGVF